MARLLRAVIFITCCLSAGSAFAAGGTCPSGANYLQPNTANTLVTLSSLGITSCYYIAANGFCCQHRHRRIPSLASFAGNVYLLIHLRRSHPVCRKWLHLPWWRHMALGEQRSIALLQLFFRNGQRRNGWQSDLFGRRSSMVLRAVPGRGQSSPATIQPAAQR